MGAADAIPGVSGGTIALILGIYERFIDALATVLGFPAAVLRGAPRKSLGPALRMLLPLGVGVGLAYVLATKLLVGRGDEIGLIQDPATAPTCFGFFFGVVLASVREPWRRIHEHSPRTGLFLLVGAVATFLFGGLEQATTEPATWMLVPGGALAISVMLLPGISGSLMLVLLNQYQTVAEAVHDRDLTLLSVFAGGLVLGAALFIPLLKRLLRSAHDPTMALLTGFMLGSLRALWPWKSHYDPKTGVLENLGPGALADHPGGVLPVAVAAVVGIAVVLLMLRLERRLGSAGGSRT